MPRRSHTARRESREADLSDLLTANQKKDLVQLVTDIIDKMQKNIEAIFDSPDDDGRDGNKTSDSHRPHTSRNLLPSRPNLRLDNPHLPGGNREKSKENVKPAASTTAAAAAGAQPKTPEAGADSKAQHTVEKEETGASSPRLQELKKEVLHSFKKWNTNVLKRLNDISVAAKDKGGKGQRPAFSSSSKQSVGSNEKKQKSKSFSFTSCSSRTSALCCSSFWGFIRRG